MRTAVISVVAIAALTLAACGSEPASSEDLCPTPTETTSVEMADFSYEPACAAVDPGATIELRNVGDAPHTFTVSDTEVDVEVPAGETGSADLAGVAAGTYEVTCTLHPQMETAIQIG